MAIPARRIGALWNGFMYARTSVSVVANTLQEAGLIRYRRGHIRILDLEGLRDTACECYLAVKSQADRLLAKG